MKKISVIVPVYNGENTILRCIDSIRKQTHRNLQIIVINDGSTDSTEEVLRELEKNDERIQVISINNSGVSYARNLGIDKAEGDYLTFVDADDYIAEEMYENLLGLFECYNAQIVHCSYQNVVNGEVVSKVGNSGKVYIQSHDEAIECLISGKLFIGGLCNKLYNKDLFGSIRLNEMIGMNEDVLANFFLFDLAEKTVYLDKSFYSYVANEQSTTHTGRIANGSEQVVEVSKIILDNSIGKTYEMSARRRVAITSLELYRHYLFSDNKENIDKKKRLKDDIKSYKKLYTRRFDKLAYVLMLYFPHIYKFVYKIYDKKRIKVLDPEQ